MNLDKKTAERYLDVLLQGLHVVDELVHDKLLPVELALAGVKAVLESLDSDKIKDVNPDEIRAMAQRLKDDLAKNDQAEDAKLKAKFAAAPKLEVKPETEPVDSVVNEITKVGDEG